MTQGAAGWWVGAPWRVLGLALALVLCGGCATVTEGPFDGALLQPRQAEAGPRLPGHVAVHVPAGTRDVVLRYESGVTIMQIQAGRIVEGALLAALAGQWQDGARAVATPPADAPGLAATLVVEQVQGRHAYEQRWLLPLPFYPFLVGGGEYLAQLSFDLSLRDAQGRTVWRRSYDSGAQVYRPPSGWTVEPLPHGMLRMAHEQAWALAQQALADVRAWVAAERMRERAL